MCPRSASSAPSRRPATRCDHRTVTTDVAIRKEKPGPTPRKLLDFGGLYLLLNPDGSRGWRFKYRIFGREKLLSLGVYPEITLKRARDRRDEARRLIADDVDPALKRQAEKQAAGENFESVAREWLRLQEGKLTLGSLGRERDRLEDVVFPYLGKHPIAQIKAPELLAALRRIDARAFRGICSEACALRIRSPRRIATRRMGCSGFSGRTLAYSGRTYEDSRGAPCAAFESGASDPSRSDAPHRRCAPSVSVSAFAGSPHQQQHAQCWIEAPGLLD